MSKIKDTLASPTTLRDQGLQWGRGTGQELLCSPTPPHHRAHRPFPHQSLLSRHCRASTSPSSGFEKGLNSLKARRSISSSSSSHSGDPKVSTAHSSVQASQRSKGDMLGINSPMSFKLLMVVPVSKMVTGIWCRLLWGKGTLEALTACDIGSRLPSPAHLAQEKKVLGTTGGPCTPQPLPSAKGR